MSLPPAMLAIALAGASFFAGPKGAEAAGPCQTSAKQAHVACSFDVRDDFWESKATCSQVSDAKERAECLDEASETRAEDWEECRERLAARLEFCALSGETYYDPPFEPGMFSDSFMNENPYWPLKAGNYWEFEGEEEVVVVNVLDATKRIDGVDCIVVNDVVSDDEGKLIEDTDTVVRTRGISSTSRATTRRTQNWLRSMDRSSRVSKERRQGS
ncbi:MAG: hypothetical protein P8Y44_13390 [Acidobacteriota bacterium]